MSGVKDEKIVASAEQIEDGEDLKPQVKTDYSGAREKTDPREIALVKKLDRWIMVRISLFFLYFPSNGMLSRCSGLCTGSIISIEMPLHWLG